MISLDFPSRSDLSRRPPCDVPLPELQRYARTEADRRRSTYPTMVNRGRLASAEADHRIATWSAIVVDLDREAAARDRAADRPAPAGATFPWSGDWTARILDLRRELATARDTLPDAIASPANPMTAAVGVAQLECLDALLHRYWVDLDGFSGPDLTFHDDHARAGWIAAAERRAGGDDDRWRQLGRLAQAHAAGTAEAADHSRAVMLADWTHRHAQRLLEERAPHHRFVWTVQVDAWLLARIRAPH